VAGLFGLIAQLEAAGIEPTLEGFAGLHRRSRFAPIVLLILLLSLAGIPPLAGFFGKFFVFAAMLHTGAEFRPLLMLLVVAIAGSTVSLYYYIQFLKRAFVEPGPENAPSLPMPLLVLLPLVVICVLTILLGVWPAFLPGFAVAN
jgi:NADH-quinone oxidoreductase subunit N